MLFVGSGIFISPKGVLLGTGSVGLCLVAWGVSALISLCGKSIKRLKSRNLTKEYPNNVGQINMLISLVLCKSPPCRGLGHGGVGPPVTSIRRLLCVPPEGVRNLSGVYIDLDACSRYWSRGTTGTEPDGS